MKKALFLWPIVAVLLFSCKEKSAQKKATGQINTISVIIDDQLWNGVVGDSIRNKFASPVIGLPKEEPLFTINQYPIRLLEGFTTNSRNIIVVKKEAENRFQLIENEFATPQNVFHISGKTAAAVLNLIESYAPEIIEKMRATEIAANQKIIDTSLVNTQKITQKFNVSLHIPKGFNLVMRKRRFMWYKKEVTSGNSSLLIYQLPISAIRNTQDLTSNIIRVRDSIGNLYIRGTVPGSKMLTEGSYAPYLSNVRIKNKPAYETRGTWELQNDFMSGPFLNYAIVDRPNRRVLILEGFVYAPSREKRDLMFELESIIKSVEFHQKRTKRK